jgi:hypothetical protein
LVSSVFLVRVIFILIASTVFDFGGERIGFAQPTGQIAPNVSINFIPDRTAATVFGFDTTQIAILIAGGTCLLAVLFCCFVCPNRRKSKSINPSDHPPAYSVSATNLDDDNYPGNNQWALNRSHSQSVVPHQIDQILELLHPSQVEYQQVEALFSRWGNNSTAPRVNSISKLRCRPNVVERYFYRESEMGQFGKRHLFCGVSRDCLVGTNNNIIPCASSSCKLCLIAKNGFSEMTGIPLYQQSAAANEESSGRVPIGDLQIVLLCEALMHDLIQQQRSMSGLGNIEAFRCFQRESVLPTYLIEYQNPGHISQRSFASFQ